MSLATIHAEVEVDDRPPQLMRIPKPRPSEDGVATREDLEQMYLIPDYRLHLLPNMAFVSVPDGKLYWDTEGTAAEFSRSLGGRRLHPHQKYPVKLALPQSQIVNRTARDIYRQCNGTRTGKDICELLLGRGERATPARQESVYRFLERMINQKHLIPSREPQLSPVITTGDLVKHTPAHMSIEITANCNIKCIHCYGTFEQKRFDALDTARLIAMMEDMYARGLRIVELTGGECTTHPDFAEILQWCCERMDFVVVLTNGVGIRDSIFDVMTRHPHNLSVQICINGSQAYHDKFTMVRNSYKKAMKTIERLAQAGLLIRSPMNLTYENYMEIEETVKAVLDAGAASFITNWVDATFGRAKDSSLVTGIELPAHLRETLVDPVMVHEGPCDHYIAGLNCKQRSEIWLYWLQTMRRLQKEYSKAAVTLEFNEQQNEIRDFEQSCGAGRRSFYLASNGEVGLCPLSVESGIPGFGSALGPGGFDSVVESPYAKEFGTLRAPNPDDCHGCPHEMEHRGCILKGMMQFMKTPTTCAWGNNHKLDKLLALAPSTKLNQERGHHGGGGCGSGGGCPSGLVQIS